MVAYIIIILLIIACGFFNSSRMRHSHHTPSMVVEEKPQGKKLFILLFIALIGLRASSVGIDTLAYKIDYESLRFVSFDQTKALGWFGEPGFQLLKYILHKLGCPWQLYFIIMASIYIIPIMRLIWAKSDDIFFSLLIFILYGFLTFPMSTMRQSAAMGFCMMAFLYLDQRKTGLFILYTLIGVMFHKSALVNFAMLPLNIVHFTRRNIKYWIAVSLAIALSGRAFLRGVFIQVGQTLGKYYVETETGGLLTELMFLITIAVAIYAVSQNPDFLKKNEFFIKAIVVCAAILPTVLFNPALSRIYFYYSVFEIVLIPNMIASIKESIVRIIGKISYIAAGAYLFFPGLESSKLLYSFFWQTSSYR